MENIRIRDKQKIKHPGSATMPNSKLAIKKQRGALIL
jgi:hypothetical protein